MFCKNLEEAYSEFFKALKVKFYEKYQNRVIKGITEERLEAENNLINELIEKFLEDAKSIILNENIESFEVKIAQASLLILITNFLDLYKEFFIDEEFNIYKKLDPLKINHLMKGDVN